MKKFSVRSGLMDPNEDARASSEAGGPNHRNFRFLAAPNSIPPESDDTPSYAAVMQGVWGNSDREFATAVDYEWQHKPPRPHIFERKDRYRRVSSARPDASTRLMTEPEFSELHAAAEFAASFHLWFDTTVTLNWSLMGLDSEAEKHFLSFTKCVRAWWPIKVPYASVYAHEHSSESGLHTHIALYVPQSHRRQFREWVMSWVERHLGRKAPRAVRVRVQSIEQPWLHWVTTSYLMKGYDPQAIVVSARNAPDGKIVYLGDLIATPWRNPGSVRLRNRIGSSLSLKPAARTKGVPGGMEYLKRHDARLLSVFPHAAGEWTPAADVTYPPFRSTYEDGARDVRLLYPDTFLAWLNEDSAPAQTSQGEAESILPDLIL